MKWATLSAFLILVVSSCSTVKVNKHQAFKDIDPTFHVYVERFVEASKGSVGFEDIRGLKMVFGEFEDNGSKLTSTVGVCTVGLFRPVIIISKRWWKYQSSYLRREELVFHELGHCILFRPHTSPTSDRGFLKWTEQQLFKLGFYKTKQYLNDGCPSSYMHPYIIETECIYKHNDFYLKELFDAKYKECDADGKGMYCIK